MRLRSHLVLLVLVSVTPLFVFAVFLVRQEVSSAEELRRNGARDTIRALSLAVDRELRSSVSVLETLAASPVLAADNFQRFQEFCVDSLRDRKETWIVLFDASGQQRVNSSRPWGSPLPNPLTQTRPPGADPRYPLIPLGGAESVRRVLATGKPVVSNLFVALDSRSPTLAVAVPVLRGGAVAYVLEMSVDPDVFLQLFREQGVPPTWTASILDARGLVIARTVNSGEAVGRPIAPELAAQVAGAPEGEGTGTTLEGVAVYHTHTRCKLADWSVSIGLSMDRAAARSRKLMAQLGGGALIALALGLFVAWLVGRRISGAISVLAGASAAFASGERPVLGDLAVREVQDLRAALVVAGDRKRAHDEVQRVNAELERRVRERTAALQSFTYTVAHDLRAPLRAMRGFADLLLEDAGSRLEAEERDYLKRIGGAAGQMDALVRDLLAYSRLGLADMKPEAVDLGSVVRDVLHSLEDELKAKRAEVLVEKGTPTVLAERSVLAQVVAHLVSNAAKFVTPGVLPRIRIAAQSREGWVRMIVEDNGVGVDPQFHAKLFGVFERVHLQEANPGTGMGLAFVKRAVERMGGRVGVDSRAGSGSTFWFELPEAAAPESREKVGARPPTGAAAGPA